MPRYFFDIDDGDTCSPDDEGLDLNGPWEAREKAIDVLPDVARDVLPDGNRRDMITSVRDETGMVLFRAKLSLVAEWMVPAPPK